MKKDYEDFLNAAGAVYAWMTISDGVVTKEESLGFARYLNTLPFSEDISNEDFESSYTIMIKNFEEDFALALQETKNRIELVKADHKMAVELIRLAREALVVDGKLEQAEENILDEISKMLDIDESKAT